LTLGITSSLSLPSHIILMLLMFAGRVGGLTLIYAALSTGSEHAKLPLEKVTVG
jgi:trk system potassium uptake protein TrkH